MTDSGPAKPPRRSRFSEAWRQEVFAATVRLIAEFEYAATTIEQIAAVPHASKATLYRQWHDKATLVVDAVRELSGVSLTGIDTGSLAGDLTEFVEMLAANAPHNIPVALGLAHAGQIDSDLRDGLNGALMPELSALDRILDRAHERGEIVADDMTAHLVRQLFVGAVLAPPIIDGPESLPDAESLKTFLHRVILPVLQSPTDTAR